MITVTVSGEQGCGKTQFVEWLTDLLQRRVKNKTASNWHVKKIVEVQEEEESCIPLAKYLHECVKAGTCCVKVSGEKHAVIGFDTQRDQMGQAHLELLTESRDEELERVVGGDPFNTKSYPHYFKPVPPTVTHVDWTDDSMVWLRYTWRRK